jgi:5-methylcytosine-specific restriction endonuclease McrA
MHAPHSAAAAADRAPRAPCLLAAEPGTAWEAVGFADLVPPATLVEARTRRDELARLLGRERAAAADFLLALADFDRRRGWERLGHASLFAFLTRELGLSSGAAQLRLSAARLVPRHPAVEAALRSGRLCISAVGQVARVLTPANEAEVLPRFLGCSAREAQEVAASILPCPAPPQRELVTRTTPGILAAPAAPSRGPASIASVLPAPAETEMVAPPASAGALHTCEVERPGRAWPRTPQVEPLTADLRRLHLTVSRGFMQKVAAARTGLSHTLPGASTEQVLEAALDLLLERQARQKALVKRPRGPTSPLTTSSAATPRRSSHRPTIPAAVVREVRLRDGARCQFPLEDGGVCGSTFQIELDHVVPLALGGPTTAPNLRCTCSVHNRRAAELALGEVVMRRNRGTPAAPVAIEEVTR